MSPLRGCFLIVALSGLVLLSTATRPIMSAPSKNSNPFAQKYTPPKYEVGWYETQLDHFDFEQNGTFKMRYLYTWEFFKNTPEKPGPIFIYAGNEANILEFWQSTGFWTNVMAPKHGALLLYPEHRYFGESLPFGDKSLSRENIKYLSTEQALADYGIFVRDFQKQHGLEKSPVIAFGGSYGGMLSGWFRMKYPQVIDGALAASAPLLMYPGITNPYGFNEVVTDDFENAKEGCAAAFREGFNELKSLRTQSQYYPLFKSELNLCLDVTSASDVDGIYNYISGAMGSMAMTDYPYPNDFLAPVPGYVVTASCEKLFEIWKPEEKKETADDFLSVLESFLADFEDGSLKQKESSLPNGQLLKAMMAAVNLFYDYEGNQSCNAVNTPSAGGEPGPWDYLACTEQVLPISSNGKTDIFWPDLWSLEQYSQQCEETWGTPSRATWVPDHYGGWNYQVDFSMYSNIIFSQGKLDPWHLGGVTESIKGGKDLISFVMDGAAHHLDLRYPNPADPAEVVKGRETEDYYVGKWIEEARARKLAEFDFEFQTIVTRCVYL